MRIAAVFALFTAVAVTSVAAYETNAQRFARGLPPNPPVRRGSSTSDSAELLKRSENSPARRDGSGTDSAEHHHPSVKPHHSHHGDDGDDDKGHKDDEKYGRTHVARDANPLERRGSGTDSAERYHPSAKPHGHHDGDDDDDDDNGDDNYGGSDAQRLARGLPSNPLVRRGSGTDSAEKNHPSAKPKGHGDEDDVKCKTIVQCCNSVSNCENPVVKTIAGLIKAKLPNDNVPVGLGCSPHKGSCSTQTVCCDDNSYDGVIAIGCISINVSV